MAQMAHWIKTLANKTEELSPILRTHMMEDRTNSCKLPSDHHIT